MSSINLHAAADEACPFCDSGNVMTNEADKWSIRRCPWCDGAGISPADLNAHVDLEPGTNLTSYEVAVLAVTLRKVGDHDGT